MKRRRPVFARITTIEGKRTPWLLGAAERARQVARHMSPNSKVGRSRYEGRTD